MDPEGMETSVVMANLAGSENVPGELLGALLWSGAVESHRSLPSPEELHWAVSGAGRFSFMHLELTWSLQSSREEMWPGEGGGTGWPRVRCPVPRKKRCPRSGVQMKGPRVIVQE